MPSYPSSFTNGSSAGQISVNNLSTGANASYQELADIVNGNNGSLSYNSAAKYTTDGSIGTEIITNRTQTWDDLNTIVNVSTGLMGVLSAAWDSANTGINSTEKTIAAAGFGNNFANLQSKLEKIMRKLNELNADVTKANNNTFVSNTASRYPSGQNRFTNTAGGI